MRNLEQILESVELPELFVVESTIFQPELSEVELEQQLRRSLEQSGCMDRIGPGQSIAIATGSREIDRIINILSILIQIVKEHGGDPFIVPAMGSHGNASAEGQKRVLEGFGITQESVGAPVISSMETIPIGVNSSGEKVHIDRLAAEADWIIPVNRIKPHTNFHGKYESGLMKMLAVGLGKRHGASVCHQNGFEHMSETVLEHGSVIIKNCRVLMGVGIVENRRHRVSVIEAIPAGQIAKREAQLLCTARSLVGELPFDGIDLLIVDEMGKDYCGLGMDPAITGRSGTMPVSRPFADKLAVLDLTKKSHGNAAGVGLADVITRRLFDKIDLESVYINGMTVGDTDGLKIPVIMDNDRMAVKFCACTCRKKAQELKIVRIHNTIDIDRYWISPALLPDASRSDCIRVTEHCVPFEFDRGGNLLD